MAKPKPRALTKKSAMEYAPGTKRALRALGLSPDRPRSTETQRQRCVALTQKGLRCENLAQPGAAMCATHERIYSDPQKRRKAMKGLSKPKKRKYAVRSVHTVSGGGFEANRRKH